MGVPSKSTFQAINYAKVVADGAARHQRPRETAALVAARRAVEHAFPSTQDAAAPMLRRAANRLSQSVFVDFLGFAVMIFLSGVGGGMGLVNGGNLAWVLAGSGIGASVGFGARNLLHLWMGTPDDNADAAAWWAQEVLTETTDEGAGVL